MTPVKGKAGSATKPIQKKTKKTEKKTSLEKQVEAEEKAQAGEQLDLIDVAPENLKPIIKLSRQYKAAQRRRISALEEETTLKQKVLAAIKDTDIKPLEDGTIRFSNDGITVIVKHRDELIQIKEDEE